MLAHTFLPPLSAWNYHLTLFFLGIVQSHFIHSPIKVTHIQKDIPLEQMLNSCSFRNIIRIISKDWIELVKVVLGLINNYNGVTGSEKRIKLWKKQSNARGIEIFKIKFLDKEIMLS